MSDLSKDSIVYRVLRFIFPMFFVRRRMRVDFRFVRYEDAREYLESGWTIAPEEDCNHQIGWVHLELLK